MYPMFASKRTKEILIILKVIRYPDLRNLVLLNTSQISNSRSRKRNIIYQIAQQQKNLAISVDSSRFIVSSYLYFNLVSCLQNLKLKTHVLSLEMSIRFMRHIDWNNSTSIFQAILLIFIGLYYCIERDRHRIRSP